MDLIIYHGVDHDGNGSAYLIARQLPEYELLPYNYGPSINLNKKYDDIYIVDVNLSLSDILTIDLYARGKTFYIDHHQSKIMPEGKTSYYEELDSVILYIDYNYAAIALTYAFLNYKKLPQDYNQLPLVVKYIEQYDAWKYKDLSPVYFEYFCRSYNLNLMESDGYDNWSRIMSFSDQKVKTYGINSGRMIYNYIRNNVAPMNRSQSFIKEWKGYNTVFLNSSLHGSLYVYPYGFPDDVDILCVYHWNGVVWKVSLYSDKNNIDVSEIARSFGGGGHKGAAGFSVNEEDWKDFFKN